MNAGFFHSVIAAPRIKSGGDPAIQDSAPNGRVDARVRPGHDEH
jgi:hypothetical protein